MKKLRFIVLTSGLAILTSMPGAAQGQVTNGRSESPVAALQYRVGFLGIPCSTPSFPFEEGVPVPWTKENILKLKKLGFNTIQLNIAWGGHPGDEPLNLEDVVELTPQQQQQYPQVVPLKSRPGDEARNKRRADLRHRIALCREAGLRTIFHFGAPYNAHAKYGDAPPNCISDEKVSQRYEALLDVFARDFPGVDDIFVYTYDQDAWLCSEFGPCSRCSGIPLHDRLPAFLNRLIIRWQTHNPQGRLWWEPWELTAGQALACVEHIQPQGFGLALHCNIAEVMSTVPVDRWVRNMATIAQQRNVPVMVEYFLGGYSEEVEPFNNLSHPLVILRGLKTIASVPGVVGIKEYFGLDPRREDPNLRMTSIFFKDPTISEKEALKALAKPYGKAAEGVRHFWELTSEGMELYPWDTSWFFRQIGRSRTDHSLSTAFIRAFAAPTPSWMSSRSLVFLKIEESQPHPWMLEDVQLRCQLAADRWEKALAQGHAIMNTLPEPVKISFEKNLSDLSGLRRRALAIAFHLRETNLAAVLREAAKLGAPLPQKPVEELLALLEADLENFRAETAVGCTPESKNAVWTEMEEAIALLKQNPDSFLKKFFQVDTNAASKVISWDTASKGIFSPTSR